MPERIPQLPLESFPLHETVPLRYSDTDRQGHINNTVFAVICEAGRTSLLRNDLALLEQVNLQFALVRLTIDFLREMHWPGDAVIGTAVTRIGSSSITMLQGIYAGGTCTATAESVGVLMDMETRRSAPIPAAFRDHYAALCVSGQTA